MEERYSFGWAVLVLFHAHFSQVFHFTSVLLTVTLAVWRYCAVAFPIRNAEWCTMARAKCAILATLLCSVACNIPCYLNYSIHEKNIQNHTLYIVGFSDLALNHGLKDVNFFIYSVVLKLLPCLALSILSLALMDELLLAGRRRAAIMSRNNDSSRTVGAGRQAERVNIMLMSILVLFLLSEVPLATLGLLSVIPNAGFFQCYNLLGDIMEMLVLFNSAVNFILYCSMSQQFRTTFKKVCAECGGQRCRPRQDNNHNPSRMIAKSTNI
ncbi:hypothetical protein HAZT_HAZT002572 [Hyalella azteca]|nr:hypothetical protein HAZT_HAZT002572 [Hyalella azteca]